MTSHDDLERRRSRLSEEKRALLLKRLEGGAGEPAGEETIPRRTGDSPPPLSFAQQRLWFLDRLEPGRPTYIIPYALRWCGPLRPEILQRTLGEIVLRHEALRTTFALAGDSPGQIIAPPGPVPLPLTDLQIFPEERREQEASRIMEEEAAFPFDLARGPLFRAKLLCRAAEDHLLLLTFHHSVFDGASASLFLDELSVLYDAFAAGKPSPLPDLPIQYADFSDWQRRRLENEVLSRELAFWKGTLGGEPVPLELPTDVPRPALRGFAGGIERLPVPDGIHRKLLDLSRREGVTLFMTLLAAFDVFLARVTGQEDILVGTPVAGRVHPDTERLIGFFVNTLVLRTDLSGNPSFLELLRRTRNAALGALDHQELPFERVVEEVRPARDPSRSPLFDVLFTLQRQEGGRRSPAGVEWTDVTSDLHAAKFDLALTFQESERGLVAVMEYRADLFSAGTVRGMLGHLVHLLGSASDRPDRPIAEFPLMDSMEEAALLALGRGAELPFPIDETYDHAFAARARETPGASAVSMGEEELTYGELDRRGNRLARRLRALGVRPETRVAVWMDRSLALPVACLGILKSGGAFVPLDPSYPDGRLRYMIEDAEIPIVVTERKHLPRIPRDVMYVICLDEEPYLSTPAAEEPYPTPEGTPERTAYVIYTSGSTGRPKGVLVSHRSLLNHNHGVMQIIGLTPEDRVLQFFSLSFDASIEDIFPTWLAGGTLVLRPAGVADTIARFCSFLAAERITVLKLPTAYWHEMAEQSGTFTLPPSIRAVTIGGEKASGQKLRLWREKVGGGVRVVNLYGPTEATVAATFSEIQEMPSDVPLPIGRPLPNVSIVILDPGGRLVPRGVAGEIVIGGAGVAKGYLGNEELTGKRFIPDPFGGIPGGRLYRTGDRGRFRGDGNIEFLGRLDAQVKVRGFRIEPGEIESVIGTHRKVSRSVVTTVADASGNAQLTAYIVPAAGESGASLVSEIVPWLRGLLPDHMIPPVVIPLAEFPLLPNGKVNVKALPSPDIDAARPAGGYVAPGTPTELQLARLWEEVLGKKHVGIHDNFFALGGHSLLAARLFARLDEMTGRNLPLATLFQAPTIHDMASLLGKEGWTARWSSLVPIKPSGSRAPLYCVHAIGGNVLGYAELAAHLDPDQPVYGLQARGLGGGELPLDRVEDMAAAYVREIREFQPEGPYFLAGACTGGIIAYEIARQLRQTGLDVAMVAMFDAFAPRPFGAMDAGEIRRFKRAQLLERITYHASNVVLQPGRRVYLRKKFKTLRRRTMSWLWSVLYRLYARRAQPLPPALRKVEEFNVTAMRQYDPGPYPGRVTLFPPKKRSLGELPDPERGWGRLAAGGVEVYEVDGDHLSMLREPLVTGVAERLSACLRRARESHAGSHE